MAVTLVQGKSRKVLRVALVGEEKSGKTTIISNACANGGIIIDSEEGSGGIRNINTPCYLVDTFGDVIEAYKKAVASKPTIIAIDSISPVWKDWQDHWAAKYEADQKTKGKIPIHAWNTIKRPWRQLIQLIKTSHVPTIVTARINYDMDMSGSEWQIDKNNWSAQAEKNFLYEMDVIVKTFIEDGKYYGTIIGARTNKDNKVLSALVGKTFENLNYAEHILPFAQDGESGTVEEHYATNTEIDIDNQKLETNLQNEAENKAKQQLIGKIVRGEAKCAKIGLYGWQDDSQKESTRKTLLGDNELMAASLEDLTKYLEYLINSVNAEKESSNANA